MSWLAPSVLATMVGTALLAFVFYYLYVQDREKYLLIWAVSWAIYFTRFIFMLWLIAGPRNDLLLMGNQVASLLSGVILLWGTYLFVGKPFPKWWVYSSGIGIAWIVFSIAGNLPFMVMSIPTFTFLATVYVFTGWTFIRHRVTKGSEGKITGWAFIAWGVHKVNYPFLRPMVWFAPYGYLLGAVLEFLVALGTLLIYFQKNRTEMRESESMHREMIANIADVIAIIDMQGIIQYKSPNIAKWFGWQPEELVGKEGWVTVHPDDLAQLQEIFFSFANKDKIARTVEYRYLCKDGNYKWVQLTAVNLSKDPVVRGILMNYHDIDQRKQTQLKLQESEQRFRELFDHMSSGVAVYDSPDDGKTFLFKDMNKAGLELGQKIKDKIVGREVREVFPGIEALGLIEIFQRVWRSGIPETHPSKIYKDDRLELYVKNYICKLPSGELVAIYDDTTARRQAEEAKRRLEKQIQQAQKMESIGNLAGGIAHDFNNILFPIVGMSELLMEDLSPGGAEYENAQEIFRAGKRGRDLVKQILAFSRQSEHQMMPVRMQQILKEVLRLGRSTIPSDIEILQDIQRDCGFVMADPTQLHQVTMNLITNAYHAVADTGGTITVRLKETEINGQDLTTGTLPPGRYAQLSVSDTGNGIEPDLMGKIFEPYFTTKALGKGTGLGLAVAFGIVKAYSGDIKVESCMGRGTTFDVYLPLKEKSIDSPPIHKLQANAIGTERILLVDDEEAIVRLQKQILERLGYQVTTRVNSLEALEAFKAKPDAYDLVITDMTMPNMTGDILAQAIIALKPGIPVIIATGFSERINQEKAAEKGIKGFLMKPVVKAEMAQMVRRVLDEARGHAIA